MTRYQPTQSFLHVCSVSGVNYIEVNGSQVRSNFHVKELRIFEDHCKPYFTGQLVIETSQNGYEALLTPTAPVIIAFEVPRSNQTAKIYTERMRLFSYDSKPISGGADVRLEHTLNLIGQEYYNDQHNTVMRGDSNITGSSLASNIHNQYMSVNGGLRNLIGSTGLIGSKDVPHQSLNVKPIKAIHDILDRSVYAQEKTGAPVYFRDKQGYVMSPLKYLVENAAIAGNFEHIPTQGQSMKYAFDEGYNKVIHMKPLSPPGEATAEATGAIASFMNSIQFFDQKTGNTEALKMGADNILNSPMIANIPGLKGRVKEMLAEASRGIFGGRNMFHIIDDLMQPRGIAKNGPGKYKQSEEAFLSALTYSQKYWVSVPIQSGIEVTCGKRINVTLPFLDQTMSRSFYVPRLIHELHFTEGKERRIVAHTGKTEMYGVYWK